MDNIKTINIGIIAPLLTQITIKRAIQNSNCDSFNIIIESSNCCDFLNKMSPVFINEIRNTSRLDILLIHEEDENLLYKYREKIFSGISDAEKIPKIFFITSLKIQSQQIIDLITKGISSFYAIENFDFKTLIEALEITQRRGGWIDPYFTITITEQIRDIYLKLNRIQISAKSFRITQQQITIIELIAGGYDNDEIAQKLKLSRAIVKRSIMKMLKQCSCKNRIALVTWAIRNNIVYLDKCG
jgi:DNA-binding NarL/FixJ family response regulator